MRETINQAELHAAQYQHVDGSFELTFGGALLAMALSFLGINAISSNTAFIDNWVLPYLPLAVFAGMAYLVDALMKRLRARMTVPRSGYIKTKKTEPLKPSTRWTVWTAIPLFTLVLLTLLFLNRSRFPTTNLDGFSLLFTVFSGIVFVGLWLIAAWKLKLPRLYLLALISLGASVVIFLNRFSVNAGMALFFGTMGAGLCLTGGLTLWQYLRKVKPAEDSLAAME